MVILHQETHSCTALKEGLTEIWFHFFGTKSGKKRNFNSFFRSFSKDSPKGNCSLRSSMLAMITHRRPMACRQMGTAPFWIALSWTLKPSPRCASGALTWWWRACRPCKRTELPEFCSRNSLVFVKEGVRHWEPAVSKLSLTAMQAY